MRIDALVAVAILVAAGPAMARQSKVEVTPNNKSCFEIAYVPAVYAVNTKGKLMRKEGVDRSYAIVEQVGGTATFTRQPAVYMEKRTLLEPDHYSMAPVGCR